MNYAIVTGATRGMGEAVAKLFIERDISVINVSRRDNETLRDAANNHHGTYDFVECDLRDTKQIENAIQTVTQKVFTEGTETVYLIQNAGIVSPIGPAGSLQTEEIEASVQVNLLSPMIILNAMVKASMQQKNTKMVIANVTSGAAKRAVHGWSTYGTTKAGLNMLTESVAFEFEKMHSKHKVIAYSPGIMDTDMQGEIRASEKEHFQDVEIFQRYKEEGMLREAAVVGEALVNLILNQDIENGKIYHVNDLL